MPFVEQMANIGSEVERSLRWRGKGQKQFMEKSLLRALELLDLTIAQNVVTITKAQELLRLRECLCDDFWGENTYRSTDVAWQKYFQAFTWAAQKRRLQLGES